MSIYICQDCENRFSQMEQILPEAKRDSAEEGNEMEIKRKRHGNIISETCGIVTTNLCAICGRNLPFLEYECPYCVGKCFYCDKMSIHKCIACDAEICEEHAIRYSWNEGEQTYYVCIACYEESRKEPVGIDQ